MRRTEVRASKKHTTTVAVRVPSTNPPNVGTVLSLAKARNSADQRSLFMDHENASLQMRHDTQLAGMRKAWNSGNVGGVFDAIFYCDEHKLRLPSWALAFVTHMSRDVIRGRRPRNAHRLITKYFNAMRHFERYETIQECSAHEEQNRDPDSNDIVIKRIRGRDKFQQASAFLAGCSDAKGRPLGGAPDIMKSSHTKVKKTIKTNPGTYYVSIYLPRLRPAPVRPLRFLLDAIADLTGKSLRPVKR
jgi:hypothetical protein